MTLLALLCMLQLNNNTCWSTDWYWFMFDLIHCIQNTWFIWVAIWFTKPSRSSFESNCSESLRNQFIWFPQFSLSWHQWQPLRNQGSLSERLTMLVWMKQLLKLLARSAAIVDAGQIQCVLGILVAQSCHNGALIYHGVVARQASHRVTNASLVSLSLG